MALTYSTQLWLGKKAPDFSLPGVDGQLYSLQHFKDKKAVLIIFMCNHCPYVVAVRERINQLAIQYSPKGVQVLGINSNDAQKYPEDSFEKMKEYAHQFNFQYPYLFDETQEVAHAYNAVCTPDPFLLENCNGEFILRYQGRIDDSWKDETAIKKKDLEDAIVCLLNKKVMSSIQHPSMGCSIKWK